MCFEILNERPVLTAALLHNRLRGKGLCDKMVAGDGFYVTPKLEKSDSRPFGHVNGRI